MENLWRTPGMRSLKRGVPVETREGGGERKGKEGKKVKIFFRVLAINQSRLDLVGHLAQLSGYLTWPNYKLSITFINRNRIPSIR
jgi:hypothetical protein